MKPYVICHTLSSIDGKIQGQAWNLGSSNLFEGPAKKIKVDAWIVGRVTMQEFCSKRKHKLGRPQPSIEKIDFIGDHKTNKYCVAIDPEGKCRWDSNMVTTEHVIEVLTKKVSTAYLAHLREKNVSYIFAGDREIHLPTALQKLNRLFGIKRARIDGGGRVNGSFLEAGLIDEISHVVAPIADGTMHTPTSFDVEIGHSRRKPKHLKLKSVSRLPGGALWIRYQVKN